MLGPELGGGCGWDSDPAGSAGTDLPPLTPAIKNLPYSLVVDPGAGLGRHSYPAPNRPSSSARN